MILSCCQNMLIYKAENKAKAVCQHALPFHCSSYGMYRMIIIPKPSSLTNKTVPETIVTFTHFAVRKTYLSCMRL